MSQPRTRWSAGFTKWGGALWLGPAQGGCGGGGGDLAPASWCLSPGNRGSEQRGPGGWAVGSPERGQAPGSGSPPAPCVCLSLPQVDPYLPYEYTCEGMLERIHAYIQHQVGGPSPGTLRSEEGAAPIQGRLPVRLPLLLPPVCLSPSFLEAAGGGGRGERQVPPCSALEAQPLWQHRNARLQSRLKFRS